MANLLSLFLPRPFRKDAQEMRSCAQNCFLTRSWVKALDYLHSDVFSPVRDRKAKEFVSHMLKSNNSIASFNRDLTQSRGTQQELSRVGNHNAFTSGNKC